jgi:hypothetical protein
MARLPASRLGNRQANSL